MVGGAGKEGIASSEAFEAFFFVLLGGMVDRCCSKYIALLFWLVFSKAAVVQCVGVSCISHQHEPKQRHVTSFAEAAAVGRRAAYRAPKWPS